MPKRADDIHTYIHTHIHREKDMGRERGRKSYFVHNMRQDVAILCSKSNTNSDKACFGPAPGGRKITIRRTRSHRGNAPYDFDTGTMVYAHKIKGERTRVEKQMLGGGFRALYR